MHRSWTVVSPISAPIDRAFVGTAQAFSAILKVMRIVFHGENAGSFSHGFERLVGESAEVAVLPDILSSRSERQSYAEVDVIIGIRFSTHLPRPQKLQLFHLTAP